jgi:hypothetical protein
MAKQKLKIDAEDYLGWLRHGLAMGWVSPPSCFNHDGVGLTELEELDYEAGNDPCVWLMRVYDDDAMREELEERFAPYSWRKLDYQA